MRTNINCSTKRAEVSAGRRTGAVEYLTDLKCSPLDPADPARRGELRGEHKVDAFKSILETFVKGTPDIKRGDILIVNNVDYPVSGAAVWYENGPQKAYVYLLIEDTRT